jgi:hypothetical protein
MWMFLRNASNALTYSSGTARNNMNCVQLDTRHDLFVVDIPRGVKTIDLAGEELFGNLSIGIKQDRVTALREYFCRCGR